MLLHINDMDIIIIKLDPFQVLKFDKCNLRWRTTYDIIKLCHYLFKKNNAAIGSKRVSSTRRCNWRFNWSSAGVKVEVLTTGTFRCLSTQCQGGKDISNNLKPHSHSHFVPPLEHPCSATLHCMNGTESDPLTVNNYRWTIWSCDQYICTESLYSPLLSPIKICFQKT